MVNIVEISIKVLSVISVLLMLIGFAFPEWYKVASDGI